MSPENLVNRGPINGADMLDPACEFAVQVVARMRLLKRGVEAVRSSRSLLGICINITQ